MGAWHRLEAWGREHPVLLGLGVFVLGIVVLYILWPHSEPAAPQVAGPPGVDPAVLASGNQLAAAQLAAQAHSADTAASLQAVGIQTASDQRIAEINNQGALGVAGLAYSSANYVAGVGAARDVQLAGIGADAAKTMAGYNAMTAQTHDIYAAYAGNTQAYYTAETQKTLGIIAGQTATYQSSLNAQVESARIDAYKATQLAGIAAATEQNRQNSADYLAGLAATSIRQLSSMQAQGVA